MFYINEDMSIYATRGDMVFFRVTAEENGSVYKFQAGDVVRFKVTEKKACEEVVLQKDFAVTEETEAVEVILTKQDTKIGDVISKPVDYWYEVELNPFSNPQTIIGYDEDGARIFKLFPEGMDEASSEKIKVVKKNYYMLRNTRMPAFLLENGFMDSSTDVPVILSEEHADKTVQGILDFLVGSFGLKLKNPYSEPDYTLYYGRNGMKPEYVRWLQWELVQAGYNLQITGEYTAEEDAAVRNFQDKNGLQQDGKCGPLTRAELKET